MYNLFIEQMAILEIEYPNSWSSFPSDVLFWNKDRFTELLNAYTATDHQCLSVTKQNYLILRSSPGKDPSSGP